MAKPVPNVTQSTMTSVESPAVRTPELTLSKQAVHSPSIASLTDHFENADRLKEYCISVNSYFPTSAIMVSLYKKLPYTLTYYPSFNARTAGIADPDSVTVDNGSTELIAWLNNVFVQEDILEPVSSAMRCGTTCWLTTDSTRVSPQH